MSAVLHASVPMLLEDHVNDLFQSSEMPQVRNLHCQTSGSEVVLRGCVSSFDIKVLAQHMAQSACGMRSIANEIVVQADTLR
ncbi:MAG: BON domain-containing protein [Planctomycetales bacterium]|nr:BON domain-containing protein [Planctomycetales bacterium]